jgi:hypothetical protein
LLDFKVAKCAKYKLLNLHGNHLISALAAFVFVPSVFGENIPTAEFGNATGRNCLMGHRKKIAKIVMRNFTCSSTFLYGADIRENRSNPPPPASLCTFVEHCPLALIKDFQILSINSVRDGFMCQS